MNLDYSHNFSALAILRFPLPTLRPSLPRASPPPPPLPSLPHLSISRFSFQNICAHSLFPSLPSLLSSRRLAQTHRTMSVSGPKPRGAPFGPRREVRGPAQHLGAPRQTQPWAGACLRPRRRPPPIFRTPARRPAHSARETRPPTAIPQPAGSRPRPESPTLCPDSHGARVEWGRAREIGSDRSGSWRHRRLQRSRSYAR